MDENRYQIDRKFPAQRIEEKLDALAARVEACEKKLEELVSLNSTNK